MDTSVLVNIIHCSLLIIIYIFKLNNWERAKRYNEEIENRSQEKASRLLEFQREVKLRVKDIQEEKQRALLAKTYRDVSCLSLYLLLNKSI